MDKSPIKLRDLLELHERERKRLAKKLEEQFQQKLRRLGKYFITTSKYYHSINRGKVGKAFKRTLQLYIEIERSLSNLIFELDPYFLGKFGLAVDLQWYAELCLQSRGVAVRIIAEKLSQSLPPIIETAIFRIAQEAIHNVAMHASASQLYIILHEDRNELLLTVLDDGVGFNLERLVRQEEIELLGLDLMKTYAASIGAELSIKSAEGEGTKTEIRISKGQLS